MAEPTSAHSVASGRAKPGRAWQVKASSERLRDRCRGVTRTGRDVGAREDRPEALPWSMQLRTSCWEVRLAPHLGARSGSESPFGRARLPRVPVGRGRAPWGARGPGLAAGSRSGRKCAAKRTPRRAKPGQPALAHSTARQTKNNSLLHSVRPSGRHTLTRLGLVTIISAR